jgi:hypothetical protein
VIEIEEDVEEDVEEDLEDDRLNETSSIHEGNETVEAKSVIVERCQNLVQQQMFNY